ncbi:D-alanyl-D-alanine carboxypeptidase family protein [Tepidimicrobium xylanilyticum]|uniref:serine-type D-Ala-D-Ala carboxypeptidase n=1 Tax=Tepidimicrobium xylanilyticum TaxID=1123352 RepID=A0A1H3BRS9_9FIRM|nr:D-alanyl-D-alanine carboxypeptidase family protein [Tepidimicrobium xylanilyticum]GMG97236.1 D-alanyl-D-alanine carboxypeptidase [Tepidimicrobium xylanilyticum]SDX44567.1 D-alanyl-D-alanine carboxypeptidase (penicillin-binding protein 5/6) [Tepidimicrobium xylanilyticum]
MKKILFLISILFLVTYEVSFADELNLSGEAAILIDSDTGQILYEKNPHKKLHPASTTKIMTGILAIELGNMEDIVTVDEEVVRLTDGSHIALEPDEQLKFEDLLNALLIESANDSALAIAKHISGSIENFVNLMNTKAKELGALNTNFVNPNGLTNENHLTTAYDLSLIAQYAMKNPQFREIVSNYTYTIPKTNKKDEERYLKSNNRLLYSTIKINVNGKSVPIKYEGVNGIKTGYTLAAQNCLVASASRNNQNLIAVVLKSNGREVFADVHKLFNYGFDNFMKAGIATKNYFIDNIEVENGTIPIVAGIINENLTVTIPKDSMDKIEQRIILDENIAAPVKKGQVLGKVEYYLDGKLLGNVDIVSTLDVDKIPPPSIKDILLNNWYFFVIGILVFIRISIMFKRNKNRRRRRALYRVPNSSQ